MAQNEHHIHISSKHRLLDLKLREVWQYRDLILLFTRRSFKVAYKQTILGPLWLFINPMLTSLVYVILFGKIAGLDTDGVPQFLFYLAGNAMWDYFNGALTNNANTFTGHVGLFGKVYFPRLTVPISNIFSSIIRFGIKMILVVMLLAYYSIKGQVHIHVWALIFVPFILLWLGILGMGLGIIISSVTTKYRDLSVLVGFGMSIWMYATPVVYPLSTLSGMRAAGWIRNIIILNPVTMPMEIYRYSILGVGTIQLESVFISIGLTVLAAFFGVIIFNKVERTFMDTV